ncbi:MAG: hypothetical protein BWY77_01460 [bacterium ADurb.Bin431]|nr:MAG: hypothetical protein BWY77_01460 [bacterium ADurb.Bin431]
MELVAASKGLKVRGPVRPDCGINPADDLQAKGISRIIMAEDCSPCIVSKMPVDTLGQADNTEHPGKAGKFEQAFTQQKRAFEKTGAGDEKIDPDIHQGQHGGYGIRQGPRHEVIPVACCLGQPGQVEPDQGRASSAHGQAIVATGDGVALVAGRAELAGKAGMVGKTGLGRGERGQHCLEGEVLGCRVRIIFEGHIGDGIGGCALVAQDDPARLAGRRPQIGMAKRIVERAVDVVEKVADDLFGPRFGRDKGFEQGVDVTDPDREIGNGRDMMIECEEGVRGIQQGPWRADTQKLRALLHEAFVIRDDVAWAPGRVALEEVADHPPGQKLAGCVRDGQDIEGGLGIPGQGMHLLLV